MIDLGRPGQRSFGEGLIEEETATLWEPWMRQADQVLEDEQLINPVYEALLKRSPKSRTRGRRGVAAEIVLLEEPYFHGIGRHILLENPSA